MKKNLSLILVFLGFTFLKTEAQVKTITDVPRKGFNGVHELPELGFYTSYASEKTMGANKEYAIQLLDYNFKPISTVHLELTKNAFDGGSAVNDDGILLSYCDPSNNEVKLITINRKGQKIAEHTIPDQKGLNEVQNASDPRIKVFAADKAFYVLLPYMKKNNNGIQVIKYSEDLKELWNQSVSDEKLRYSLGNGMYADGKVIITYSRGLGMITTKYEAAILGLNDADGKQDFNFVFPSDNDYQPTQVQSEGDHLLVGGPYFDLESHKRPEGVFIMKLGLDGKMIKINTISWPEKINADIRKMKDASKLNISDEPMVMLSNMAKTSGGYQLVGEAIYKRIGFGSIYYLDGHYSGSIGTCVTFEFEDFVVVNLDEDLQYQSVQIIDKPKNRINLETAYSLIPSYYLYAAFKTYNLMNYQFVANPGKIDYGFLVYTVREGYSDKIQIAASSLDPKSKTASVPVKSDDLTKIKDVERWGVLKAQQRNVVPWIYKKQSISFYEANF